MLVRNAHQNEGPTAKRFGILQYCQDLTKVLSISPAESTMHFCLQLFPRKKITISHP